MNAAEKNPMLMMSKATLQQKVSAAFEGGCVAGRKSGIREAIELARQCQGESVITLRMKLRALLGDEG